MRPVPTPPQRPSNSAEDDPTRSGATSADHDLLLRHAPILGFDHRELFLPTAVDGFVACSTLFDAQGRSLGAAVLDHLDGRWSPGTNLRFITDADRRSLGRDEIRNLRRRTLSSRLGRVGLFGRLIDALFLLSVWMRPTTPRRTSAAAASKAERFDLQDEPVCYGRTVRAGEWLVLHYAYFYVMNDWRSSYRGLNDHEADWEQVWVFCDPATSEPIWVTTSSHDHRGADLRRHWADPELVVVDDRPHLFVGAGSHALFYRPGDYVTRIDVPALRWVLRAQRSIQGILRVRDAATERGLGPALGVPFIDTTDGTGVALADWDLRPMENQSWIERYRGLWGTDTGDPLQGERGPSGPKFDRRGEVRASWADPLGFAGLHGTPPPSAMAARISGEKLERVLEELDEQIRHCGRLLPLAHQTNSADEMANESRRLTELLRHRCELEDVKDRVATGQWLCRGVRDHLRHPAVPLEPLTGTGWILAAWAAASVPMFLIGAAGVLLVDELTFGAVAAALVLSTVPIEYVVRRQFAATLRLVMIEATVVAFFVFAFGLMLSASRYALGGGLIAAGLLLLSVNGNELRSVLIARRRLV